MQVEPIACLCVASQCHTCLLRRMQIGKSMSAKRATGAHVGDSVCLHGLSLHRPPLISFYGFVQGHVTTSFEVSGGNPGDSKTRLLGSHVTQSHTEYLTGVNPAEVVTYFPSAS